jgi:hypothetical protein
MKKAFWFSVLALATWACNDEAPTTSIEYPLRYAQGAYENGSPGYYLVGAASYSPVQPVPAFAQYVEGSHAQEWVMYVGENFDIAEVILDSEDSARVGIFDFDEEVIVYSVSLNVSQADGRLTLTNPASGAEFYFEQPDGPGSLHLCEVSYYHSRLNPSVPFDYTGFLSELCQNVSSSDYPGAGIERWGFAPGDTMAVIQSTLIYELQE